MGKDLKGRGCQVHRKDTVGKCREMRISQEEGVGEPLWLTEVVLGVRQVYAGKIWGKDPSPLDADDSRLIHYVQTCPTY